MCTWMLKFIRNWPYLIWIYETPIMVEKPRKSQTVNWKIDTPIMVEKPRKSQTVNWKIDLHECVNYILCGILNEELWKWN
jgi:hypothetical protein